MTALSPMGLAALTLAQEVGAAVFPCWPRGKAPRIHKDDGGNGCLDATSHAEQISEWWDRWPEANIGLVPGSMQWLVMDVDGLKGEELARSLGALAVETLEVSTSRGRHRYFRLPKSVSIGNMHRDDFDIRAHSGYVMAPPSVHESGRVYRWRGDFDEIADIPERLLAYVMPPPPKPARRVPRHSPRPERVGFDSLTECRVLRYAATIGYGIGEGGRNNAAYSFAFFLSQTLGLSEREADCFLTTWNRYNCPPLSERELNAVHHSARSARGRAGTA